MGVIQRLPESVVNRIAAGEVVVRPANAVKELLENSLDAGAREVVVSLRQGGLQLLQVQDNGKGIQKDDLEIVCERFTTSKLQQYEDLQSMKTYGFRGEALASVSHVSKVSITSKPKEQACAYQAKYIDGKMLNVRSSAGLDGTCITAEELFYNCPSRAQAFRNHSEETVRVADIVTRYAVHRPDVSFAMRRGGSGSDFRTNGDGCRQSVISSLLGKECGENLQPIEHSSSSLKFTASGCFTKPLSAVTAKSVQAKKARQRCQFLFINGRSVQCAPLKHALESVFADRDLVCPFLLVSIEMDPSRVDVNVHPTKQSVMFLEEEDIIEDIRTYVDSLTAVLFDQQLAPRSVNDISLTTTQIMRMPGFTQSNSVKSSSSGSQSSELGASPLIVKKMADHMLVRTDSRERRLDAFLTSSTQSQLANLSVEMVTVSASQSDAVQYRQEDGGSCRRVFSFESLDNLRRDVCNGASQSLRDLFKSHTFVGCVNAELALLQHTTSLYLVDLVELSKEMYYQTMLFSFGNLGSFRLEGGGVSIRELLSMSDTEGDDHTDENLRAAADFLYSHSEMLHDYVSLTMELRPEDSSVDGEPIPYLVSIPSLVNGFVPQLEGLPTLVADLVHNVDWEEEQLCFEGVCRAVSKFFVIREEYCSGKYLSALDDSSREWVTVVEEVILPRVKGRMMPQERFKNSGSIRRLADLHDLYKVFERC